MGIAPSERHPQVGAPDPDRETSPIVADSDEIEVEVEPAGTGGVCRFNGVVYALGSYVLSGTEVLRCEPPGLWVREGELPPRARVLE